MLHHMFRGKPLVYIMAAVALTGIVWIIAYRIILSEREHNLTQSAQQAQRLAEFFEQQSLQIFRYSDAYLRGVRREYLTHGGTRGGVDAVRKMLDDIPLDRSIVSHVTIIDKTGTPLLVSGYTIKPGTTAKDREYFQTLQQSQGDPIYISLPHQGRNSDKLLLRLARRINTPDGDFDGVIFAAIEVERITEFFRAMNLGPKSSATLIGTDKRIRARSSYGRLGPGQDMSESRIWRELEESPVGFYKQTSVVDGITRYYAYRKLAEFPLIVAIGVSVVDIAQASIQLELPVLVIAVLATLVIITIMMTLMTREYLLRHKVQTGETRLRTIVESVDEGIVTIDESGYIESFNSAVQRMFGYEPDEVLGQNVAMLAAEPHRSRHAQYLRNYLTTGQGKILGQGSQEVRAKHKDGTVFPAELSIAEMRLGRRRLFVGVIRDATERTRLEEQLRQAQKMEALGTLAGGIAHEFNNLLASILGFTELATYDIPPTTPAYERLQNVLTAGNRAKDLVQQILTFSRHNDQRRQRVALPALVEESLRLVRASVPATIGIESHIAPDAGAVLADPTHLHQIVINLCANAGHAMRQTGGTLEVRVTRLEMDTTFTAPHTLLQPGSYVRLTVHDTGSGIPPEVVERIFEPFFTTKGVGEGTGMGLSIVHGIVTSYGGAITVESTPGVGTTFAVYLPRAADTTEDTPAQPVDALPQGEGCILLVDDEKAVAEVEAALLTRLGYEVVICTSGPEALDTFRATPQRFAAVVTDQTMPAMTGEHLARGLHGIRPDIPIVLCTGFSHVIDAGKAHAMGISAFCMKPLTMQEIGRTIQDVLDKHAADAVRVFTPSEA